MTRTVLVLIVALIPGVASAQDPFFEAPFDGSDEATLRGEAITGFASMNGPFVPGIEGRARVLGGMSRLSYFIDEGLFPPRGTLSLWVRPEDWTPAEARHFVFFATITLTDAQRAYVRLVLYKLWNTDQVALLVQNTPQTEQSTLIRVAAPDWEEGGWHQLVATWDAERYHLFIDGEPVGDAPAIALPEGGRWELAVGTPYQGWAYLGDEKTAIDQVTLLPEPLSAEEVRARYEQALAAAPPEAFERPEETGPPPVPGNLALADEGAWVLASSFADYEAHYPDNLIDGREASTWMPFTAGGPQWLEVRWRLPRLISGVVVRQPAPGRLQKLSASAWSWVDRDWRSPGTVEGIGPDTAEIALPFEETLTDRVRVTVEGAGAEPIELSTLAVTGPEGEPLLGVREPVLERMPVSGRERVQVELVRVRVTPDHARPGDWVDIDTTISPRAPLAEEFVFALEVGETPLMPGWSDLFVAGRSVAMDGPLDEWVAGSQHSVQAGVRLPEFAPDGPVGVRLVGRGAAGSGLEVVDAAGEVLDTIATLQIDRFADGAAPGVSGGAVRFADGSSRLLLGGEVTAPLAWAMTMPSFDRYHQYSSAGVQIYHAKTLPLNFDDVPGHLERVCAQLDERITSALRVDPEALFIVNPDLRPEGAWLERNPDERLVTAQGALGPVCFSSAKYTAGVHDFLARLVRYIHAQPYANHVVGWLPYVCGSPDSVMGGLDGNLFQLERDKLTFGDHNPQAIAAFREWLRTRYGGSVEDLRATWHDPELSFETATPVVSELVAEGVDGGVFRDPLGSAMTFDYAEWLSGVVGRFNAELMRIVKREAGREVLAGTYYGYDVAHLRGYNSPGPWLQNNNFDLHERLQDPNWDFFAEPTPYSNRRPGTSWYTSHSGASYRLHGKLFMGEIDHRTFIAAQKRYGRMRSEGETQAILRRDMAALMIDGQGYWFSDWSRGEGRDGVPWFGDPGILGAIEQGHTAHTEAMAREHTSTAQIAVFTTGRTMRYHDVYRTAPIYHNLIPLTLWEGMGHLGAPYDLYSLDDLGEPQVRDGYGLYVFVNAFFLQPEDRAAIEALKSEGRTLLFLYAPGYVSREDGLTVEGISDLVGMGVVKRADHEWMEYETATGNHPILQGIAPGTSVKIEAFGYDLSVKLHPPDLGPVFAIDDPEAAVLATYPDGQAALAARDLGQWRSVYCAVPRMTSELLRGVARWAGVHLYCDEDVVLDADNRLLMLHSGWDGDRTLRIALPEPRTVTDAWTGEVLCTRADRFEVALPESSTRLLRLE